MRTFPVTKLLVSSSLGTAEQTTGDAPLRLEKILTFTSRILSRR